MPHDDVPHPPPYIAQYHGSGQICKSGWTYDNLEIARRVQIFDSRYIVGKTARGASSPSYYSSLDQSIVLSIQGLAKFDEFPGTAIWRETRAYSACHRDTQVRCIPEDLGPMSSTEVDDWATDYSNFKVLCQHLVQVYAQSLEYGQRASYTAYTQYVRPFNLLAREKYVEISLEWPDSTQKTRDNCLSFLSSLRRSRRWVNERYFQGVENNRKNNTKERSPGRYFATACRRLLQKWKANNCTQLHEHFPSKSRRSENGYVYIPQALVERHHLRCGC